MKNVFKNEKVRFFAIGALAATAGVKFLKSETFRKGCVKTVAGGMKIREDAASSIAKIKEDAQDVCYEAKMTTETEE